jgi:hypothetical protein
MASERIPVNRDLIAWARKRAGLTIEEAAEKFTHIAAWEAGSRDYDGCAPPPRAPEYGFHRQQPVRKVYPPERIILYTADDRPP